MNASIPEEAIVDAVFSDALVAATLLVHLANRDSLSIRAGLLADIAREQNITSQKFETVLEALIEAGLLSQVRDGITLTVSKNDALRHAAVLRGVAYARYRQREANQVEITLSPPAHPSRLMEMLPTQGFSWTRLYDTKDSLIELASQTERRLVIISPFLDKEGIEWIGQLFETTAKKSIKRIMILRGRDQTEADVLTKHSSQLADWGVDILTYAISHDPAFRSPAIETFHAKILLADSDKAYVGSAKMTRWSRDFSMECGVILRGPSVKPVATLVEAMIKISNPWAEHNNANS
jgi:phosphatidylserine/phosphatidylglycerophosphate/cardiolipin synthase-like enzyme